MPQQTQWQSGYCSSTLSYQSGSIWFVQQIAISSQYSHIRCRCNSRHDSNWANEVQEINAIIPWSTTHTGTSHTIWWQQKYERVIYATSKATQAPPYVIIQHYVGESLATEEYLCAFVNGKLKTKTRQISWVTNILGPQWCVATILRALLFWRGDTLNVLEYCDTSDYTWMVGEWQISAISGYTSRISDTHSCGTEDIPKCRCRAHNLILSKY